MKCSLCGKKFQEGRGAGVHLKRIHKIGSNDPYPHSPTPVMSSTNSDSSNTPRSSRRLRRRSNTLPSTFGQDSSHVHDFSIHNSTNPIEDTPDNVSVRCQSSPINPNQSSTPSDPIPHHPCSISKYSINRPPQPILLDLDPDDDPDEDSLDSTHSPPRPIITNPHHTSFLQQSPASLVALSGCTDVISDIPSQTPTPPPERIPSQIPPNPPVISITSTSQQTHPDPLVALNGSTDSDGECGPNQSSNPILTNPRFTPSSPNSASQNPFIIPPPLSDTFPSLSSDMSPTISNTSSTHANLEPTVTLSGHTVGNSDADTGDNTHRGDQSNSSNSSNTSEFVREWSSRISTTQSFDDFCSKCDDFANAVVSEAKSSSVNTSNPRGRPVRNPRNRPNSRLPNRNRRPLPGNPIEARRIQTLFRLSKKRAARRILQDNNTIYTGTKDQAQQYFTDTFSTSTIDVDELISSLSDNVPPTEIDQSLMDPMSSKEIKDKLKCMSNSAPGKDRVEYRHLKMVDPNCSVLGLIFNKCLEEKKIPLSWKQSTTILIYKKGSSDEPSNFRPIALMSCVYKLFTSILSSRISNFAINEELISNEQKSAKPAEGCHEHSFTLQSVVADCKRNQKNCFFAWLDLRNAFGSISHDAIYTTLEHMGFSESLISLIRDIYTDSTTVVRTRKDEETDAIPVNAGVKQGCPVSPILFNLTTELLIRKAKSRCDKNSAIPYQLHGHPVDVLAYADDLVLISRTRDGLQTLLNDVSSAADILNLNFRPDKCASLSLTCNKREPTRVSDHVFIVQQGEIPVLAKEESYRYLGVPIGLLYDASDMNNITTRLISDLEKIRDSLLTPWQKLDAIRTFIQPGLTYALRTCPVTRLSLSNYRKKLIEVLRSICNLPKRATQYYFFADRAVGGLGLQDPFEERHIQSVVHTVKILSVSDPFVSNVSKAQLSSVVSRCFGREASNEEIDEFLSGSLNGDLNNHSSCNNSQTLWSRCRISARALKIKVKSATENITISVDDFKSSSNQKGVASYLHRFALKNNADKLMSLPDQGKVARCLQTSPFPSTNSWCYDGTGIRFCDWRFIHRARTNTLPTNDVKSRFARNNSPSCRNCHSPVNTETLPHIICHCQPNMPSITKRHDSVLQRLTNAIKCGSYTVDKVVPGAPGNNRPDLVITDKNKVTIIDVTCPFENDEGALSLAASRKEEKYNYLIDHFRALNVQAKVFGFVVGPLGGWFSGNEKALDEMYMSKSYRTLFRKLCCADAIKGSRNIYVEHLTGVPQH